MAFVRKTQRSEEEVTLNVINAANKAIAVNITHDIMRASGAFCSTWLTGLIIKLC